MESEMEVTTPQSQFLEFLDGLSKFERERIESIRVMAHSQIVAREIWVWHFTPAQRRELFVQPEGDVLSPVEEFQSALAQHKSAIGMWQATYGCSRIRAFLEVALRAVGLSHDQYALLMSLADEWHPEPERALEQAYSRCTLVLAEKPRRVWFEGEFAKDIDWELAYGRCWVLLWELARCAKSHTALTFDDFVGQEGKSGRMKNIKYQLTVLVPNLEKLIVSERGSGYSLNLRPEQIEMFQVVHVDVLRRVGAELGSRD